MNPLKPVVFGRNLRRLHSKFSALLFSRVRRYATSQEKNVIRSPYPDIVVPNTVFSEYIWKDLEKWPDKTAFVCGVTGRGFTYHQSYKMSMTFAASLRNKLKVQTGDRIAILMPNIPEYPIVLLGGIQAGCVVTLINPLYKTSEIQHQLSVTEANTIITTLESFKTVSEAINDMNKKINVIVAGEGNEALPAGAIRFEEFAEDFSMDKDCLKDVSHDINNTAILPFSSGTTGMPKGVEITQRNLVAAGQTVSVDSVRFPMPTTETHQDVVPAVLPFFHIYGLMVVLLGHIMHGCKLVTLPRFTPQHFLDVLEKHNPTLLYIVPPIALFLAAHPDVKQQHFSSLRRMLCGAAPLNEADVHRLQEKAKKNFGFYHGYGLTETTAVGPTTPAGSRKYNSIGVPLPSSEVKIVSIDSGENLGPNQDGELYYRSDTVMKGYYKNPSASEEALTADGWLRTGDFAYYDQDNLLYVTDRLKELIKVKGFQVAPAELEGILRTHPKVSEAAVIGTPHPICGEMPKAYIVTKNEQTISEDELKSYLAEKVSSFKKLDSVQFVQTIPKNASGKILRRELKVMYA